VRSIDTIMAEGKAAPKRKRTITLAGPTRRNVIDQLKRAQRFAPVLVALVADLRAKNRARPAQTQAGDAQVLRIAAEELRRLLEVSRVAYLQADGHHLTRPCSCALCEAVWKLVEPRERKGNPDAR